MHAPPSILPLSLDRVGFEVAASMGTSAVGSSSTCDMAPLLLPNGWALTGVE